MGTAIIEQIEQKAAPWNAIEDGWQQQEIHLSAYKYLAKSNKTSEKSSA